MVTYTEVTGDLFRLDLPALGHGCNCQGFMGAGIASTFRRRWPGMFNRYRELCIMGLFRPGDVFPWDAAGVRIYNLATQDQPGPDATLGAIGTSVEAMLADADAAGIPQVGIPRIGAGIGGLAWLDVASVLRTVAGHSACELTVVTLPEVP